MYKKYSLAQQYTILYILYILSQIATAKLSTCSFQTGIKSGNNSDIRMSFWRVSHVRGKSQAVKRCQATQLFQKLRGGE